MARPPSLSRPRTLPTGTLTFLFSDIEGSTRLVNALGPGFGPVLARHHALLRSAFEASGGVEMATEGDAFFVVFPSAPAAVVAAAAAQRALAAEPWPSEAASVRVRIGLHSGEGLLGGDNYIGIDVHRAARISAAAHGGQVLMSETTRHLAERSLPADLRLRDLGEFRLKDLEAPERLVQLLGDRLVEDFPPPRTIETPSNLPPQVTSFIGRAREVEEASALVRRSHLVTLTGPGGTGKTRLALVVAERLTAEFPGGAFFVDLSALAEPSLIPTTVAQALGVREEAARPILESLEAHLRDLRVLVVLDNLEQLVKGASVIGQLLQAAPRLAILVTSREVLHLRGEQEYPVPPLDVPDPAHLPPLEAFSQYDAVALFIQRAQAVRPDFRVDNENAPAVAAICARLDGLPLAIELAAARVKLFAPEAILSRLENRLTLLTSPTRDIPERQRTLRGAIDWSHDLLDPTEQALFRRLAIFVGGFSLDSAQAVCNVDGEFGIDMLDALAAFVDKSLLRQAEGPAGEPRFAMLETIREYGLEHLAASDDAELARRRHEDYFAALALQAEPEILGAAQKEWLDRLDVERDNLRAALQAAGEDGRTELALGMGAALWRFWLQRGHLAEGREILTELLDRADSGGRTGTRARALAALGGVIYWQGDFEAAGSAYTEALEIERTLDDPSGLADALYNEGWVATLAGDNETAGADYEESRAIYERLGDRDGVLRLREAFAVLARRQGDLAIAQTLEEQNLAAFRESGESFRIANALTLLAGLRISLGAFEDARAALREAAPMFREAGDIQSLVRVLILGAALFVAEGDTEGAARLTGAADTIKEPLGEIATPIQLIAFEDPAAAARAALGDEAFDTAYRVGGAMTLDEAIDALGS